jgi:hypothetical protein
MLKLRSVRAIPNVITHLSFVFPTNLIWLIYYIVTQWILIASRLVLVIQNVVLFF